MKDKNHYDLNEKQMAFAQYYAQTLNATQAAIKAGYPAKTARQKGHNMITNEKIKKYLNDILAEAATQFGVTPAEIIAGIKGIAYDKNVPANVRLNAFSKLGDSIQMFTTNTPQVVINNNNKATEMTDEELENEINKLKKLDDDDE